STLKSLPPDVFHTLPGLNPLFAKMIGLQPAHTLIANRSVRSAIGLYVEMPLTAGSFAAGTYLYSFPVVIPGLSGASPPHFLCFLSSFHLWPTERPPPNW